MVFDDMIKTESSDLMREHWENYRNSVTDYAIRALSYEAGDEPTLAIWGAGGMNDFDLCELARHFKVVLIDRDLELIKRSAEKFTENPEQVPCIDLKFWDITDDDYRMFEALLHDGECLETIENYLLELVDSMVDFDKSILPMFDYSICSGVASQLNVRFLELARAYDRQEELEAVIRRLNEVAVSRMLQAIDAMTKKRMLYGYEAEAYLDKELPMLYQVNLKKKVDWITEDSYQFPLGDGPCDIAGNDVLEYKIIEAIASNKYALRNYMEDLWPFSPKKEYKMLFLVLEKV